MGGAGSGGRLLERETEVAALAAVVGDALAGRGRAFSIEGPAGIGKTRLLEAGAAMALDGGARVLRARGSELEANYPFGLARQLFEPAARGALGDPDELFEGAAGLAHRLLTGAPPEVGMGVSLDPAFPLLHGLYWLLANVAESAPVALVIDDLHHGDEQSVRFLRFLAPRLPELPVAVGWTFRTDDFRGPDDGPVVTSELAADVLRPQPLSEAAVTELLRERLGEPEPAFTRACHLATGGNPFYLDGLLQELAREGAKPSGEDAILVTGLGPTAVSAAVLARITRLGEEALALSRATAVLGDGAELRHAASLAGLDLDPAGRAADGLVRVAIFDKRDSLAFNHPILRNAVLEDLSPYERAALHRDAARLLEDDGAPAERVAAHLLRARPAGEQEVVRTLREAAARALDRGAPGAAVRYLRRAFEEPPPRDERPQLLLDLGSTEYRAGEMKGLERFARAAETAVDPGVRARALVELGRAEAMTTGELDRMVAAFERARGELPVKDDEVALELEAELLATAMLDPATSRFVANRLERFDRQSLRGDTPPERVLLAVLAFEESKRGNDSSAVTELANQALRGGLLLAERTADSSGFHAAVYALLTADRFADAEEWYARGLEQAREKGLPSAFSGASTFRAHAAYRRGAVLDAEAHARAAINVAAPLGFHVIVANAAAFLVEPLIERGELEEARRTLEEHGLAAELPPNAFFQWPLFARARLNLASGDVRTALEDLLECGRREAALGARNPARFPWRSQAALAHLRLGDAEAAAALAAEERELAVAFGTRRAIGIALVSLGLCEGGERGLELLAEAAATLEGSGGKLDWARALVELGAALRRANRRQDARDPLRRGLELAHRCGARRLEQEAADELAATGARPRRAVLSGVDALTASERRVARMAADGMANREIAQALFVTQKAVEKHLGNAYAKLGLSSRHDLAAALGRGDALSRAAH